MLNLQYHGKLGKLYAIWFSNLFFNIITLFLYRPWAKTKIRKYIYSNIEVFGDRLEYSGTGRELFNGYIKAWIYIFLLTIALGIFTTAIIKGGLVEGALAKAVDFLPSLVIFLFIAYYAKYAAIRYRLTRSRWRGIRGGVSGSAKAYTKLRVGRLIVNILTLGLAVGKSDLIARRYIVNNSVIGKSKFIFTGDVSYLDSVNFITGILAIPTLFFSRLWYVAALKNYGWRSTSLGNIKFDATFSGGAILWMVVSNFIILVCTFGLGTPIMLQRIVKFSTRHIEIIGFNHDLQILLQSNQDAGTLGEGVLDDLDVDDGALDIDMGIW